VVIPPRPNPPKLALYGNIGPFFMIIIIISVSISPREALSLSWGKLGTGAGAGEDGIITLS
jgi:hypothetical protein